MIYQDIDQIVKVPLASVFIFTYNQEHLVKQTINSIVVQKCDFPYEIIICDDYSKDNTLNVCVEYQKKNPGIIKVIHNEKNLGLRVNFFSNILCHARGTYVAICAGDDWWSDCEKLSKQVNYLRLHPECGLVHTKAQVYIDRKKCFAHRTIGSDFTTFFDNLYTNHVAALTMCFPLSYFKQYVDEVDPVNLPYSEDYPLVLWFSYRTKVHFISEATSVYRYLINSVSHSTNIKAIYKGPLDFYNCGMHFLKLFGIDDKQIFANIELRLYIARLQYAHLLKDSNTINKAETLFKSKHFYVLLFLSKLYAIAGENRVLNSIMFFLQRVVMRFHPTRKLFK